MKKQNSRPIKKTILGILLLILSVLVGLLTEILGDDFKRILESQGINNPTNWIVLFCVLIVAIIFTAYDIYKNNEEPTKAPIPEKDIETNVKRFSDSLKKRYQNRYEQKLDGRFEISLEVSENWDSTTPQTISEQFDNNASSGEAIKVISEIFEKKGRLLIVGEAGAGKTVLLLKLAMSLLNKITDPEKEPFPVIFNLASWSEDYEKFEDWLIEVLYTGNGLSRDFAATLLQQKRIVFLLDGLDEIAWNENEAVAAEKRAKCLSSINGYLSYGQTEVICCRIKEYRKLRELTGQDAPVAAKVSVIDLTKEQIEKSLLQAADDKANKTAAENLLGILDSNKGELFTKVLRSPFYFTTARKSSTNKFYQKKSFPQQRKNLKNS